MPNQPDRRVRKTRSILRGALASLMEQKSIQEITVKELCEVCDLNRGTFYLHYRDVYDLLHSVEAELQSGFEAILSGFSLERLAVEPGLAMEEIFAYLAANADMCRVLLCKGGDMAFVEQVEEMVRAHILGQWRKVFEGRDETYDYVFAFIASGCIGILQRWLESGMPQPPAEIARLTENIISRGIAALQ